MNPADDMVMLEQRLRALLEENTRRASGRVRSHLTQARHAAVAQAASVGARGVGLKDRRLWVPAAGVVAAAAVMTFVMRPHQPRTAPPMVAAHAIASGDLGLLTDREGLTLVENGDGEFYEWAVYEAQTERGQVSGGTAGHAH